MSTRALILATLLAVAGAASAQTTDPAATPGIDKRQARQQQRIEQGKASGQLTEKEATRMQKRQDRIAQREAQAKADGTVTAKERARLQHQQNKASRKIRHNKHDAQKSG